MDEIIGQTENMSEMQEALTASVGTAADIGLLMRYILLLFSGFVFR